MKRALVLYSGGLDSILTVEILLREGFTVSAYHAILPFEDKPINFSHLFSKDITIIKDNISMKEYKNVLLNPKFGYGKALNPCIDCKIFIFKRAKQIFEDKGYDVFATGEVAGERPMSQRFRALNIIEEQTNLRRKILRPLSAKVLPQTIYEEKGIVERAHLYGIKGRKRDIQIELAKEFNVRYYPQPAGGCLLTDKEIAKRLKQFIKRKIPITNTVAKLINRGRIFPFENGILLVGRNEYDNKKIEIYKDKHILLYPSHRKGPNGIIFGQINLELAGAIIARYSDNNLNTDIIVEKNNYKDTLNVRPLSKQETRSLIL